MSVKKTWIPCTDKTIQDTLDKVWEYAKTAGYAKKDKPALYIVKSKAYYGICHQEKNGTASIAINEKYVGNKDSNILNVMIHEVAHACCDFGEKHGAKWKSVSYALGSHFNETIKRTNSSTETGVDIKGNVTYKYSVKCSKCNNTWHRTRMCGLIEHPQTYICPYCKTQTIVKNY